MNIDHLGEESHLEKLDADAVCIQCGTVNAEGTLLCKVCGNNLRDQRNRRLMSDQVLEMGPTGPKIRNWLSPIMFILAVGLILSTLYNQDLIVDWIMAAEVGDQVSRNDLWRGPESETLDALASELADNMPTGETADAARLSPVLSPTLDGIYVLYAEDVFVGAANVFQDGEGLYFVAQLESGEELRGHAVLQGNFYVMAADSGGLRLRNRLIPVQGIVSPQGNGVVECVGDDGQSMYSCLAFQMGV